MNRKAQKRYTVNEQKNSLPHKITPALGRCYQNNQRENSKLLNVNFVENTTVAEVFWLRFAPASKISNGYER